MSSATEITTSRRGDVTNARDKQTVLCPLLISNYWTGGCCELKCAWFYCLLRSYKSTLQLCGLSEHVDVAFITNQKWVWLLSDCYVLWKVLVQAVHAVSSMNIQTGIRGHDLMSPLWPLEGPALLPHHNRPSLASLLPNRSVSYGAG